MSKTIEFDWKDEILNGEPRYRTRNGSTNTIINDNLKIEQITPTIQEGTAQNKSNYSRQWNVGEIRTFTKNADISDEKYMKCDGSIIDTEDYPLIEEDLSWHPTNHSEQYTLPFPITGEIKMTEMGTFYASYMDGTTCKLYIATNIQFTENLKVIETPFAYTDTTNSSVLYQFSETEFAFNIVIYIPTTYHNKIISTVNRFENFTTIYEQDGNSNVSTKRIFKIDSNDYMFITQKTPYRSTSLIGTFVAGTELSTLYNTKTIIKKDGYYYLWQPDYLSSGYYMRRTTDFLSYSTVLENTATTVTMSFFFEFNGVLILSVQTKVYTSTDGVTWNGVTIGIQTPNTSSAIPPIVDRVNNRCFTYYVDDSGTYDKLKIYYSSNGVDYSLLTTLGGTGNEYSAGVAYSGSFIDSNYIMVFANKCIAINRTTLEVIEVGASSTYGALPIELADFYFKSAQYAIKKNTFEVYKVSESGIGTTVVRNGDGNDYATSAENVATLYDYKYRFLPNDERTDVVGYIKVER